MKVYHCIPTSSVHICPCIYPWDSDTSVQSKSHEIQILPLLHDRICDKTWDGATSQGPDLGSTTITGWDGGVPIGRCVPEGSLRTRNGSDKGSEGARGRASKTTQKLGESGGVASEKRVEGVSRNYQLHGCIRWNHLVCCTLVSYWLLFHWTGTCDLEWVKAAQKVQNRRAQNLVPNTAKSRLAKYPNHLPKKIWDLFSQQSDVHVTIFFFKSPTSRVDNQSHCVIFPHEALKKV